MPSSPQASTGPQLPPWAEAQAHLLDNAIPIPGTGIRFGLDAIIGLVAPGAGDLITAFATAAFLWVGFRRGAPKLVLLRMLFNLVADAVVGAIPMVGDVFDVFHRAASKNLALARACALEQYRPSFGDYVFVVLVFACLVALLVAQAVILALLVFSVSHWLMRAFASMAAIVSTRASGV